MIQKEQRDSTIREQIKEMLSEKSKRGVKMYKEAYVYDYIGEKWGLAARTIANIWRTQQIRE